MGVIGKHVVSWTETSVTVYTTRNATWLTAVQAAEDFLRLDDTNAIRAISRPRCRRTIPSISPRLLHNYNTRHCRVTAHSYCTVLCLGGLLSPRLPFKPAKFGDQAKKAQWKTEDEVLPQLQEVTPQIAREVRKSMSREGVTGTKEELNAVYSKRFNEAVSADAYMGWAESCADATPGTGRTEETVGKTWRVASADDGRPCADATTRIRAFFVGVLAVNPISFCAGLRDVPNLDLVG